MKKVILSISFVLATFGAFAAKPVNSVNAPINKKEIANPKRTVEKIKVKEKSIECFASSCDVYCQEFDGPVDAQTSIFICECLEEYCAD